jgi:pimeloyl-ACP methyl ester carboxylesterase
MGALGESNPALHVGGTSDLGPIGADHQKETTHVSAPTEIVIDVSESGTDADARKAREGWGLLSESAAVIMDPGRPMNSETAGTFSSPPPLPPWLLEQLPFERRVFSDGDHSIHFVDEGRGPTVLLLHGNPTWCYLWRKVIPILSPHVRVVAPDLVGLGLSSKPRDPEIHTLSFHADRISALIRALDLADLTIVGQDWGGPIVALAAARNRARVSGAVFANTALSAPPRPPREPRFHRISHQPLVSEVAFKVFRFPISTLHKVQGDPSSIGAKEKRAYRFPFAAFGDRVAPLALARLVPIRLEDPTVETLQEVEDWAKEFEGPVQLVWGIRDPILGRSLESVRKLFPDAPVVETEAGHFLQEEVPEELAKAILDVVGHVDHQG